MSLFLNSLQYLLFQIFGVAGSPINNTDPFNPTVLENQLQNLTNTLNNTLQSFSQNASATIDSFLQMTGGLFGMFSGRWKRSVRGQKLSLHSLKVKPKNRDFMTRRRRSVLLAPNVTLLAKRPGLMKASVVIVRNASRPTPEIVMRGTGTTYKIRFPTIPLQHIDSSKY